MCKNCETELADLKLRMLQLEKTVELQQNDIKNLWERVSPSGIQTYPLNNLFCVGHSVTR